MSQHTPGPWTFNEPWVFAQGVKGPIARTSCNMEMGADSCELNGALISAAPDLLASLKAVLALVDSGWISNQEAPSTFSEARAAVAKAEGRA